MIYVINLLLIPAWAIFCRNKEKNYIKCICLQLILLGALRAQSVGGDLGNYLRMFQAISQMHWNELYTYNSEFGYVLLCKLLSELNITPRGFLVVTSILSVIPICWAAQKYSSVPWMSIFFYVAFGYYSLGFSMVRQTIAMGFLCASMYFAIERKPFAFIISVIVAMSFHMIAVVFLAVYPIMRIKIAAYYFVIVIFSALCLFIAKGAIVRFLLPFARNEYSNMVIAGEGYGLLILYGTILITSFIICPQRVRTSDRPDIIAFFWIMAACFLCQIIATEFSLFTRVTNCFFVTAILLLPNILFSNKEFFTKHTYALVICLAFMGWFFIKVLYGEDTAHVIPYAFL